MLAVERAVRRLTLSVMDCARCMNGERTEASRVRREQDLIQIDFMQI